MPAPRCTGAVLEAAQVGPGLDSGGRPEQLFRVWRGRCLEQGRGSTVQLESYWVGAARLLITAGIWGRNEQDTNGNASLWHVCGKPRQASSLSSYSTSDGGSQVIDIYRASLSSPVFVYLRVSVSDDSDGAAFGSLK